MRCSDPKFSSSNRGGCRSSKNRGETDDSLEAIVENYLRDYWSNAKREIAFFRGLDFEVAVTKAALAQTDEWEKHPHQWRIPVQSLEKAKKALLSLDLKRFRSFDELHSAIKERIDPIWMIGALAIYDTAHRIGANVGLRPRFVYFHAGSRKGARAPVLNVDWRTDKLQKSVFPNELQHLTEEQIEDCLCIFSDRLHALGHAVACCHA
jgi:hypothetical protein